MSAPKKVSKKKSQSVLDRLTNPANYTGAHKHRFDKEGRGRGLAGRKEVVNFTGSTSSATRDNSVKKTVRRNNRKPVVQPGLGKQKFGTQAAKAKKILCYRNGDKHHKGAEIALRRNIRTMEQLYQKATEDVQLTTGAVRKILKRVGGTKWVKVKELESFEDGGHYLCCGGEKPAAPSRLPDRFLGGGEEDGEGGGGGGD